MVLNMRMVLWLMVPHQLYTNASSMRQFWIFPVPLGFFQFACVVNWLAYY